MVFSQTQAAESSSQPDWEAQRRRMVRDTIARRGIHDGRVLAAMERVPRHEFVPAEERAASYDDNALPLGLGQTISQAYTVAFMAAAAEIRPADRVLEIGTGSGYGAAVLAELAAEVHSIERLAPLAAAARQALDRTGYGRVQVHVGDGTLGWPDAAPYDAIVVTAGGPRVPPALREQIADGGRIVMPVGDDPREQELVRVLRQGDAFVMERLGDFRFVPLVGEQGWRHEPDAEEFSAEC